MYNTDIRNYSEKIFEYQKEINFVSFMELSDEALKKINILALERLIQNITLESFKYNLKNKKFIDVRNNIYYYFLTNFFLFLILIVSHIIISIVQIVKKNTLDVKTSKIVFFGDRGNITWPGYVLLSSLFPNSSFYALIGLSNVLNKECYLERNTFFGLEANKESFIRGLKLILVYVKKMTKMEVIRQQTLKSRILFFCEYLKVIYANEKSKIIANNTPPHSMNIFMCDNNFFHTVHIDRLNKLNCNTAVIQHGTSLSGNIVYIPVLSKYILCCSQREAKYFQKTMLPTYIYILGMPIQILFEKNENKSSSISISFDILILGRNGSIWETEMAYQVLNELEKAHPSQTILVRHHPGSNKQSKTLLENFFQKITISKDTTLKQDIDRSNIIISFSVDANIVGMIARKNIIFCGDPESDNLNDISNPFLNLKIANSTKELNIATEYFLNNKVEFETDYDEKLIYTFGEYSIEKFEKNFFNFICDHKQIN